MSVCIAGVCLDELPLVRDGLFPGARPFASDPEAAEDHVSKRVFPCGDWLVAMAIASL